MQIHLSSLGKLLCRGLGKSLCTADVFRVLAQVWMHYSICFKKRDLCLQHVLLSPLLDGVVSGKVLLPLCAKAAHTLSKQWQHQAPLVARVSRLGSAVTQTCLCSQLLLWRCLWGRGSSAGCRDMFCPNWDALAEMSGIYIDPINWTGCLKINFLSIALRFVFPFYTVLWCCPCSAQQPKQTWWRTRTQVNSVFTIPNLEISLI